MTPTACITTFSLLLVFIAAPSAFASVIAVRFGRLVDGSGRVLAPALVVIENDRIRSVSSGDAAPPAGAERRGVHGRLHA